MKHFFKSLEFSTVFFFLGILFLLAMVFVFIAAYQTGNTEVVKISSILMLVSIPVCILCFSADDII